MSKPSILLEQILKKLDSIEEHDKNILVQTTKTNGNVQHLNFAVFGDGEEGSGLIKRVNKIEHWKSKIKGVIIALSVLWTAVSVIAGIYFSINH